MFNSFILVNGIFKKGIRIVSSQPISVVGFNYERYSADAFRVIPLGALSSHYIAVTYGQPHIRTQLACLAVRDNTLIRVTLPHKPIDGVTEPVVDIEGMALIKCEIADYLCLTRIIL